MKSTSGNQEQVKEKYGSAARAVAESGSVPWCCDPGLRCCDPITSNLYSSDQPGVIPEQAVKASLGCGNPTALIDLRPGQIVLDLGSGGGIDVLLSAQRVGPTGKAYGLDMTNDMLALARENQRQADVTNVEFLKGEIENIPLDQVSIEPTRFYNIEDARQFLAGAGVDVDAFAPQVNGKFFSALVRANKPQEGACCDSACCG